jgi:hypothetical protein
MEPGKVNIVKLFGRETLEIKDVFASAPQFTDFLRAYAFNENKTIRKSSSGHKTVWTCKSEKSCQ